MPISELAGKIAPRELLVNVPRLVTSYYALQPNTAERKHQVSFGTSGHRGSSLDATFNEAHILATCQAICDYRQLQGISGPLFLGMDTHALSEPAHATALEVFAANDVPVHYQSGFGYTPTPVISHAILNFNRGRKTGYADGVVITPSHNPPGDGGIKYNPPEAGPADTGTTQKIQERANHLLEEGLKGVRRTLYVNAIRSKNSRSIDFVQPYVDDLVKVVDLEAVARAGIKIGVDPMGGAAIDYWDQIADRYRLDIEVVNRRVDPTFAFMTVDWDGQIRMDCSSQYAMASLIKLRNRFDIAFGNDPDVDRHGIITPSTGLLDPNHYLVVAVWYLFTHRPGWDEKSQVGKTLVSSSLIDRVANHVGRRVCEVPVGFKYFVDGLINGNYGFGGEESAGASFLRFDGTVWTTDKDGFIMDLLAGEILAVLNKDPGQVYHQLEAQFGKTFYARLEAPATPSQKEVLKFLAPEMVTADQLAGYPIRARLTNAPGNNAPIGGLKVSTDFGWFAARPSGTEDIYKIYAESMVSEDHLKRIQNEAKEIVADAFRQRGL